MKDPTRSSVSGDECLTILSISPFEEDHARLQAIIGRVSKFVTAQSFSTAKRLLVSQNVFLVICERDSPPTTWIECLDYIQSLPTAPFLIVTSRLADERLWAEVLNLGGWDVLAKPFDDREVLRTVRSTLERYRYSGEVIGKPPSLTTAD
jgi:DNA-binding response OmpR family regulator